MKRILLAGLAAVAVAAPSFGGGELPGPINYTPAPVYSQSTYQVQSQYAPVPAYAPAPVAQPVVVARTGGIVGYTRNRLVDVGDVFCETFDAVVGLVTLDPARDDQY